MEEKPKSPGRPNLILVEQRRAVVEQAMRDGLSPTQMCALRQKNGRVLGNYKTILNDVKTIQGRKMEADPEWFNRTRIARIEATERLKAQLIRLTAIINDPDQTQYSAKEKIIVEGHYTKCVTEIYKVETAFDPEMTYNRIIQERMEAMKNGESNSQGAGEASSRDSQSNAPRTV